MQDVIILAYKPDKTATLSSIDRIYRIEPVSYVTIPAEEFNTTKKIVKHVYSGNNMVRCVQLLRDIYPDLSLRAAKMAIDYAIKESLQC